MEEENKTLMSDEAQGFSRIDTLRKELDFFSSSDPLLQFNGKYFYEMIFHKLLSLFKEVREKDSDENKKGMGFKKEISDLISKKVIKEIKLEGVGGRKLKRIMDSENLKKVLDKCFEFEVFILSLLNKYHYKPESSISKRKLTL